MRDKAIQAPDDLVNHHRIWGSIDSRPGAASDESSSSSSAEEIPAHESLTAKVDKKLIRISVTSGSSSSSRCAEEPGTDSKACMSGLADQFLQADAQEQSESELDMRSSADSEDSEDEAGAEEVTSKYVGLDVRSPTWSIGAELHDQDQCRPCAWYWKAVGCTGGIECQFCHMCGPGVFQLKTAIRRAERVAELQAEQRRAQRKGQRLLRARAKARAQFAASSTQQFNSAAQQFMVPPPPPPPPPMPGMAQPYYMYPH
mmetsp:Transcript_19698/g.35655  ORF Transcript_19698/g.35655 Transcript_19698/m.35655 type:complete len:258 (+) Transcript_19698:100-873(+)